jgi:hypothetical protein
MTKPSRRASNGRLTPLGETTPVALKHARERRLKGASVPPARQALTSPAWIARTADTIAVAALAQAEPTWYVAPPKP